MKSSTMEYRHLPGADIEVSAVSMGTLGFPRGKCSSDEIAALTHRALDLGVNFIDTAHAYGRGDIEAALGPVLETRRDDVAILTRGHLREPDEFREAFEGSFERLRTDFIEVFELHDVTNAETYEKVMTNGIYDMVREKVEQGKIGCVGISSHGPRELLETMITSGRFKVITVAYNLTGTKRSHGDGELLSNTGECIMPLAREHGIGITVMKPFGGGAILQKAPDGTRLTPGECLRYVLANPLVSTVSPGVNDMAQLEEAVAAGQPGPQLTDGQKAALEEKGRKWGQFFCRRCGYCLPCEKEIQIPSAMQLYEEVRAAGADAARAMLPRYEKFGVKPSECVECGVCEERCPYDLPISERMRELAAVFEV